MSNFKQTKKLADEGDASAQYHLACMYRIGKGATKNKKEAIKWFTLAAEQGHAIAQYILGVMLANGEGVTENNTESVKWFRRAHSTQKGSSRNLNLIGN